MKLFTAIYDDARLLSRFLWHYDRHQISEFLIAASPSFVSTVKDFMSDYPITLIEKQYAGTGFLHADPIREMREIHHRDNEWAVVVDLDEFVEFDPNISHILSIAESEKANVVRGIMYDRFSADGKLGDPDQASDLLSVFPIKANFIHQVQNSCDHKGVLVKGPLKGGGGYHHWFEGEKLCSEILEISHYRWLTGAIDRYKARYAALTDAGTYWADEYKRIIDHYEQHGRFAWEEFGGAPSAVGDPATKFYSLYTAAQLKEQLGLPEQQVIDAYLEAAGAMPTHAEALHGASRFCRNKGRHEEGFQLARKGLALGRPSNGFFIPWIYDHGLLDELAVNAYWSGHYRESLDACVALLASAACPAAQRERIAANARFALEKVARGPDTGSRE